MNAPIASPPRPRGRPRDPAKRAALVRAARTLFLREGVDAVTTEQIVTEAGVARATLYSYFADKAELLEAVIARESERVVEDDWLDQGLTAETAAALLQFGERLLAFLAAPDMLDCERIIEQAAKRTPEHGRRFFAAGPGRALAVLTEVIRAGQERGALAAGADPTVAAHDLMGLWQGFWRKEAAFGARAMPDEQELRALAAHGVEQFLVLYRPR